MAAARARERAETAFREEPRLPVRERAALADYARSGWDRGHMAPAGDMPTAAAEAESFTLANTVPQDPELNRGLWADVEAATRELAHREGEVFVLTGPLFEGGALRQLNGRVLVPTGLWKAVWAPARGEAGAWVAANAPDARPREVALAKLDGLAGVAAFPALPPAVRAAGMRLPEPLRHEPRHPTGRGAAASATTGTESVALTLLLGLGAVAAGGGLLTWRALGRGRGRAAPAFRPFADEAAARRIGGLTVENRTDRVSLGGGLDLTRDRAGLAAARELLGLLGAVVAALEAEGGALPDTLPPSAPPVVVPNPFGEG